jgi:hypothetical protein
MYNGMTLQPKLEDDIHCTPKYKSLVKIEAENDNLVHTNDQRLVPRNNHKIFDNILKSLETPKLKEGRSQSKIDQFSNRNFGFDVNKENFDFKNFGNNDTASKFMIEGS